MRGEDCGVGAWCSATSWRDSANYDPATGYGIGVGTCRPCFGPRPLSVVDLCHDDGSIAVHNLTNFSLHITDQDTRALFQKDLKSEDLEIMCDECVQGSRGITAPPPQFTLRVMGVYQYLVLGLIAVCAAGTVAAESRNRVKTLLFCILHPWDSPRWQPPKSTYEPNVVSHAATVEAWLPYAVEKASNAKKSSASTQKGERKVPLPQTRTSCRTRPSAWRKETTRAPCGDQGMWHHRCRSSRFVVKL